MRISYILKLAWINIISKKLRSSLTIGGIGLSIGITIFMIGLNYGIQDIVTNEMKKSELANVITVDSSNSKELKINQPTISKVQSTSGVSQVDQIANLSGKLVYHGITTEVPIYAVTPNFFNISLLNFTDGSKIADKDKEQKVLVANKTLLKLLGIKNSAEALDKKVSLDINLTKDLASKQKEQTKKIAGAEYQFIGVVDKGDTPILYMPIETLRKEGLDQASQLKVSVSNPDKIDSVRNAIGLIGFKTTNLQDTLDQINKVFKVIKILTFGIGLITLLIAIFGTLNTITVSLIEQIKEVGYLRIIGIRKQDVEYLFMIESILLSLGGIVVGIFLSFIIGYVVNFVVYIQARNSISQAVYIYKTPISTIILLFFLSLVLGFVIGIGPSRKATKIDPLKALRY